MVVVNFSEQTFALFHSTVWFFAWSCCWCRSLPSAVSNCRDTLLGFSSILVLMGIELRAAFHHPQQGLREPPVRGEAFPGNTPRSGNAELKGISSISLDPNSPHAKWLWHLHSQQQSLGFPGSPPLGRTPILLDVSNAVFLSGFSFPRFLACLSCFSYTHWPFQFPKLGTVYSNSLLLFYWVLSLFFLMGYKMNYKENNYLWLFLSVQRD